MEAKPKGEMVSSTPGMGLILTAKLLAEADDIGRYGAPDRFAAQRASLLCLGRQAASLTSEES